MTDQAKQQPGRLEIRNVRASFPELFNPRQFMGEGQFRCGISLLISPTDPQAQLIKDTIKEVALAKWKDKAAGVVKALQAKDKLPLHDGDTKSHAGYAGMLYLSANTGGKTAEECPRPMVVDADGVEVREERLSPIYAGCYVNAIVDIWADTRYGDGINCKLMGVMFERDGEAFGSARVTADAFAGMVKPATDGRVRAADFSRKPTAPVADDLDL